MPLLTGLLLLGACSSPYSPTSSPDFANVPYYPPGSFFLRLDGPYHGHLMPPSNGFTAVPPPNWDAAPPLARRVPDKPAVGRRIRAPEPALPASEPLAVVPETVAPPAPEQTAIAPEPQLAPPTEPLPIEARAPKPEGLHPVDPSCGWWRLCNLWRKS